MPNEKKTTDRNNHSGNKGQRFQKGNKHGGRYHASKTDEDNSQNFENDISWYAGNSALAKLATEINFNVPLGSNVLSWDPPINSLPQDSDLFRRNVPGVAALRMVMTPGVSNPGDYNSPINIAARNVYMYLRRTLSSNLEDVQAPDIMVYLTCLDSLHAFYYWVQRFYGALGVYSALNKYYGRYLIKSIGGDPDDLIENVGQIKFWLESFRQRVNSAFVVPADYGFIKRHSWLFRNFFADGETLKSQIYAFIPDGFYRWGIDSNLGASSAKYLQVPEIAHAGFDSIEHTDLYKWEDIRNMGEWMLSSMLNDDDVSMISGLLLRAVGSQSILTLEPTPENYVVVPVYSKEILGQIHNMDILYVPAGNQWGTNTAYPRPDLHQVLSENQGFYLENRPTYRFSTAKDVLRNLEPNCGKFMDSFVSMPTSDEIIINSRCKVVTAGHGVHYDAAAEFPFILDDPSNPVVAVLSAGLDYCVGMYISNIAPDGEHECVSSCGTLVFDHGIHQVDYEPNNGKALLSMCEISKFDWAPRMVVLMSDTHEYGSSKEGKVPDEKSGNLRETLYTHYTVANDVWDYNNPAVINSDNIRMLHEAALIGAFKIDVIGSAWDAKWRG